MKTTSTKARVLLAVGPNGNMSITDLDPNAAMPELVKVVLESLGDAVEWWVEESTRVKKVISSDDVRAWSYVVAGGGASCACGHGAYQHKPWEGTFKTECSSKNGHDEYCSCQEYKPVAH